MTSKLLYYDGNGVQTRIFQGTFRGLAWEHSQNLILVGNGGRILKIQDEKLLSINSGTRHNLRAVAVNPSDGAVFVVGNAGTALLIDEQGNLTKIAVPSFENLRAVAWHRNGSLALLAGNNGALFEYSSRGVAAVDAGPANLRGLSWRPNSNRALITSNCFAEEFIPSPNLYDYDSETNLATAVNEGRVDLIGVDWKSNGESALVVGYDVVWHNGLIGVCDGTSVSPIQFENRHLYPASVAWKPSADIAAIVTATAQAGIGRGTVFLWDGRLLKPIFSDPEFFFSHAAWALDGKKLAAIASTETRTFNS